MLFPDEGTDLSASSGNDPSCARAGTYGPIELRRYVKGDRRALILYTRASSTPAGGPVQDESAGE